MPNNMAQAPTGSSVTHMSAEDMRMLRQLSDAVPAAQAVTSNLIEKAHELLEDQGGRGAGSGAGAACGVDGGLTKAEADLLSEALQD